MGVLSGEDECRYGLFKYKYKTPTEDNDRTAQRERIVLVVWKPVTANPVDTVIYSMGIGSIRENLPGIQTTISVSD